MHDPAAPHERYADWKAPAEDGGILLWPEAGALLRDADDNSRLLRDSRDTLIQNIPLPDLRSRFRAFIGHADDAAPLIATGHQAELHHPGVWVKNALIDAVATKLGGQAYHFAIDSDAPKHLLARWPGGVEPLTDDASARIAKWSELVDAPTPAHLRRISEHLNTAAKSWRFRPVIGQFFESLTRLSLESAKLPIALTNALHELDWDLGLRHHAMVVSPLWQSEPYLVFVHHLLARADVFALDYNAALAEYRRLNRIHSPGRPMPDLTRFDERCEVPFWLDDLGAATRGRASVTRVGGQWILHPPAASGDGFTFDPALDGWDAAARLLAWLRQRNLRLAPRALTLTAVLRLLAADQFVHGIGGARYDQVLDTLIASHFRLEPPRFCVTTATLYFPDVAGQPRACVPCVKHEGHRLRHQALGNEKRQLVEAISGAPRGSTARSALFHDMRSRLSAAAAAHPALAAWDQEVRATAERERQERMYFDREMFYAIQPRERLIELIERYRREIR